MKVHPHLDDLKVQIGLELGYGDFEYSLTNIDDAFRLIAEKGIKAVHVNRAQMLMIVLFFVANASKGEADTWHAWKALEEGKVSKFLGVELKLDV